MKFTLAISTTLLTSIALVSAAPLEKSKRQAGNGSCGDASIQFADGLDGRNEPSFQAVNKADFNQGSALNIKVIAEFICGQLESKCKASAATVADCNAGATAAAALTGQAAADAFNQAVGGAGAAGNAAGNNANANDNNANGNANNNANVAANNNNNNAVAVDNNANNNANNNAANNNNNAGAANGAVAVAAAATGAGVGRLNLDLGSCTDPTMIFQGGVNGRPATEFTYLPNDQTDFGGQQEALNPSIIANFICDTFVNVCKAGQDAIDACATAQAGVDAAPVRDQSVADNFNAALGF